MDNLNDLHYRVLQLLQDNEACRNSDRVLLSAYYKKHSGVEIDFTNLDLPMSIIRSRRKIQTLNPALKGNSEVEKKRTAHSKVYSDFYKNNRGELVL